MGNDKVSVKSKVITDIQSPYIDNLTHEEKEFWNGLKEPQRTAFLYMNHECKNDLMYKRLNEEDEVIMWEHGAKLAFQYSNSGFKQQKIMQKVFGAAITVALLGAAFSFSQDIYFNTYAKNRQLNLESLSVGGEKYEIIPLEAIRINNHKGLLEEEAPPSNAMSLSDYVAHIQRPNFKCGELESLAHSFKSDDGYPLCRENSLGDKYIVGYAKRTSFPELLMSVIHEGKIYNLNLDEDFGIETIKIQGADTLTKDRVMNSFAAAFPEAVREYKANAVTKQRKQ